MPPVGTAELAPGSAWRYRSFLLPCFDSLRRNFGFGRRDPRCLRAAGHSGAVGIDAPLAFNIVLRSMQKFACGIWMGAREHRIARFLVCVLLQGNARRLRVQLEWILSFEPQRRIVPDQRPVARSHGGFLLFHAERHIVAVSDAMAVSDDK